MATDTVHPNGPLPSLGSGVEHHTVHLTATETAHRLGISARTLYRMAQGGSGPPWVRVSARRRRYRVQDVEAWEQEQQQQGGAPR